MAVLVDWHDDEILAEQIDLGGPAFHILIANARSTPSWFKSLEEECVVKVYPLGQALTMRLEIDLKISQVEDDEVVI